MIKFNSVLIITSAISLNSVYANNVDNLIKNLIIDKNYEFCYYEESIHDTKPTNPNSLIINLKDKVEVKQNGVLFLKGPLIGYNNTKILSANWITYNQKDSHINGEDILLYRQYNEVKGKWIDYYLNLDKGYIYDALAKDYKSNMTAKGSKLEIFNKNNFSIDNSYFTSCNLTNPAWHVSADKLKFDYQDSQGIAQNSIFYIKDLPILYSPYLQFPLGKRNSGLLIPEVGGQTAGFFVGIPFYWNMAENYDMTITPKAYVSRGFMLSDEFRYLNENGDGTIYTEQVLQNQTPQYRYYWKLKDDHYFDNHKWNIGYDYSAVSDNNYFVDYGNFNTTTNNINLLRSTYLQYMPKWGEFNIKLQGYQTLFPINQPPSQHIYSVLPQINLNINNEISQEAKINILSQYSNFNTGLFGDPNNSLQNGQRVVFYPSITWDREYSWGYIKPKFGLNNTYYQLQPYPQFENTYREKNRLLPITSIDSGLVFDKNLELNSTNYVSTLEPRLYYLYIPQLNQSDIPVFDTATASPNLNQLFSENIFSGFDRINSANNLTLGVTSRLINSKTGDEFYNLGLGYRYYFTSNNNLLYGSYNQFGQLYQPTPNFITEITNNWTKSFSTIYNLQYDSVFNNIEAYSFQLRYNPENHKIINARFNYQYQLPVFYYALTTGQTYAPLFTENQYAVDISSQWPLFSEKWLLDARTNYDFTRSQFLNAIGGIEYNAGCWSVSAIYQQYLVNLNEYNQAYFIQFNFHGLTSVGSGDPTQALQLNIPGYVPIKPIY